MNVRVVSLRKFMFNPLSEHVLQCFVSIPTSKEVDFPFLLKFSPELTFLQRSRPRCADQIAAHVVKMYRGTFRE